MRAIYFLNPGSSAAAAVIVVVQVVLSQQRTDLKMVRPPAALSIEAESLVGSAQKTHGDVSVQNMQGFGSQWSGGAQLFWGGAQAGARLTLPFSTTVTGRHEVSLHFTQAPDFGIVRAQIDNVAAVTINGYAPTVTRDRIPLGVVDLRPGSQVLRLELTTKDGKSTGFNVGLDRIEFQPVSDQRSSRTGSGVAETTVPAVTTDTIPILRIPAGATAGDDSPVRATVEPLPMSSRIEIVQKALSSTSQPLGTPGPTVRLSARAPKQNMSGLSVWHGTFMTIEGRDWIQVSPNGRLYLNFEPVEAGRVHLFECGCSVSSTVDVRLGTKDETPSHPSSDFVELATLQLDSNSKRLLAVVVPSQSYLVLVLGIVSKPAWMTVFYCELTPFK